MKKLFGLLAISGVVLGALFLLTSLSGPNAGNPPAQAVSLKPASHIQEGSFASIEYTLTDDNGNVIETNVGKEPLTYIHGAGQIVRGLEKELYGLKPGDRKKVRVSPEEGYGVSDPKALQEVLREKIPAEAQHVGATLMTQTGDGRSVPMRIHEIKEKTVIVDFNHPLAGKTLNFDVKIVDIKSTK
jgi:FKBP-type peptidyl-prolyl cis-trans isomerase SlyD